MDQHVTGFDDTHRPARGKDGPCWADGPYSPASPYSPEGPYWPEGSHSPEGPSWTEPSWTEPSWMESAEWPAPTDWHSSAWHADGPGTIDIGSGHDPVVHGVWRRRPRRLRTATAVAASVVIIGLVVSQVFTLATPASSTSHGSRAGAAAVAAGSGLTAETLHLRVGQSATVSLPGTAIWAHPSLTAAVPRGTAGDVTVHAPPATSAGAIHGWEHFVIEGVSAGRATVEITGSCSGSSCDDGHTSVVIDVQVTT